MNKRTLQIRILLMVVIALLVGFLSTRFNMRLDFTGDKRYTLSKATRNILKSIDEPVTVTAYFSTKLPPNVAETKNDFRDLLVEYASRSGGNLVYEFIDPTENEELEREAQMAGIQMVMINVREKDEVKQQKAYLGAVLRKGEQKEVIPFLQPGAAMEYALSSNIKKLIQTDKPSIVLLQGHGEPNLNAMQQVVSVLQVLYDVSTYNISETEAIPQTYESIIIVAPKDSFNAMELMRLDEYVANGGNLLVALNRVMGDFNTSMGSTVNTGLETWLSEKGVDVADKFLMDAQCGTVTITQQQGFFRMQTPVQFPYMPLIADFADHPISKGLERVLLPFASPVTHAFQDTTISVTVLAKTSNRSNTGPGSTYFNVMKNYSQNDFPLSSLPVAIAAEGRIAGDNISRLVVFGDGDFAVNGEGREFQQLQPDNVSLLVNAVEWLSDDTGLNELRTKGVSSRPIKKELEDNTKTLVKFGNFLAPIFLILGYGLVRLQIRARRRKKWMEDQYV